MMIVLYNSKFNRIEFEPFRQELSCVGVVDTWQQVLELIDANGIDRSALRNESEESFEMYKEL